MKWSAEADRLVAKVPFFVRKKVKKRVEEEAARAGALEVKAEHVISCQQKFLKNMEAEVQGFQVEACFGSSGCPNRALEDKISERMEQLLRKKDLKTFLKERVKGPLKLHHEFRVSLSSCPNACSRPQIVDFGVIGACRPGLSRGPCTQCLACGEVCGEGAVELTPHSTAPVIHMERCVACGQCIKTCPTGALEEKITGYRILLGGKLGRHPQLAMELPGIYSGDEVVELLEKCIHFHMTNNREGERFGEVIHRFGEARFVREVLGIH